jgi:hypothetical protein
MLMPLVSTFLAILCNLQATAPTTGKRAVLKMSVSTSVDGRALRISVSAASRNVAPAFSRYPLAIDVRVYDKNGKVLTLTEWPWNKPEVDYPSPLDIHWVVLGENETLTIASTPRYTRAALFLGPDQPIPTNAYSVQVLFGFSSSPGDTPAWITQWGSRVDVVRKYASPVFSIQRGKNGSITFAAP